MLQEHFDAMLAAAKQRSLLLENATITVADRRELKATLATAKNVRLGMKVREANLQKAMDLITSIELKMNREARL